MVAKGRQSHGDRHGACVKGERNGRARLSEAQVATIKRRLLNGEYQRALAREYGMERSTIRMIAKGRNWAHVPPA